MNRTIRFTAAVLLLTAFMAWAAAGSFRMSSADYGMLPYSCDYYATPTIATQDINSAGGILNQATATIPTEPTRPDILSSADVSVTDVSPADAVHAANTTAASEPDTSATSATTTSAELQNPVTLEITSERCNIRSDAGAEYELLKVATAGEKYEVTGTKLADNGIMWMRIVLDSGQTGYVCAKFCRLDGTIPGWTAYLTFDDGPTDNTPKILDILDRYGVKATFFVIYHSNREKTYKDIVDRGHTLALHSYTHDYEKIYKSETAYFNDLEKLADYVEKVTGERPAVIRFPGGSSNTVSRKYNKGIMTKLTAEVERRGYVYFDWNLDSGDASGKTVKKSRLVENIRNGAGAGGEQMVLMHDAATKTTTVEALPEIIEIFKNYGYDFKRITTDTPSVHQAVAN